MGAHWCISTPWSAQKALVVQGPGFQLDGQYVSKCCCLSTCLPLRSRLCSSFNPVGGKASVEALDTPSVKNISVQSALSCEFTWNVWSIYRLGPSVCIFPMGLTPQIITHISVRAMIKVFFVVVGQLRATRLYTKTLLFCPSMYLGIHVMLALLTEDELE